jgi:putative transcriptional regulator
MGKKYKSDVMASIHEAVSDLNEAGLVDKKTMKEFDSLCLTPIQPMTAEDIRNLRQRENISQVVFAHYLNVTKGLISQWERGEKKPSGASLKLLSLVDKKGLSAIA